MFATLAGGYPSQSGLPPGEAVAAVVADQAGAGLGLLSDGAVHPVTGTPEELVAAWQRAREAAAGVAPDLPVKLAVVGPFAGAGLAAAAEVAAALHAGLGALLEAGCPVVEIHEPAAGLPVDEVGRAAFVAAHRTLLAGLGERLHATLAVTGGDAVAVGADALFAAPFRSYLFDVLDGPDSWRLVRAAPGERGIIVGVADASGRGRTRLEDITWAAAYAASAMGRGMDRVAIAPSGSLAHLPPARAREVLALLGEAAATIAGGREAVLDRLDPRAISARAAALGRPGRPAARRPPMQPGVEDGAAADGRAEGRTGGGADGGADGHVDGHPDGGPGDP